ncbi:MAG: hypothetical protein OXC80_10355, partial [Gammaproteobacteria bacterium]|nr:hypothetical protein [Gammaproteobacteria bacterium]
YCIDAEFNGYVANGKEENRELDFLVFREYPLSWHVLHPGNLSLRDSICRIPCNGCLGLLYVV